MKTRDLGVVIALTLPAIGCAFNCTLIGCVNGIMLQLGGSLPASTLTVDATGNDSSHVHTECTGACSVIPLENFRPSEATIVVSWTGGSKTVTVSPTYEVTYPNGKACGPECHSAQVIVNL